MLEKLPVSEYKRKTTVKKITTVDAKEVSKRDIPLRYDNKNGNLGTSVSTGVELFKVTTFDKIILIRDNGNYNVITVPEKLFAGQGLAYCNFYDKDELQKVLFTVIYRDPKTKFVFIKRCRIGGCIMNKDYFIAPDGMEVLHIDSREKFSFTLNFVPKPRMKETKAVFKAQDYEEKGLKAQGVRLINKEVDAIVVDKK